MAEGESSFKLGRSPVRRVSLSGASDATTSKESRSRVIRLHGGDLANEPLLPHQRYQTRRVILRSLLGFRGLFSAEHTRPTIV